jgi:hypothetical protein
VRARQYRSLKREVSRTGPTTHSGAPGGEPTERYARKHARPMQGHVSI